MGDVTGRFRRSDRLRDSRDFRRVSRDGRRLSGKAFVLLVADAGPGVAAPSRRLGLSASRQVGNSVVRNRVKRGVREWFRRRRGSLPDSVDIVVIARSRAASLDAAARDADLDALARRLVALAGSAQASR